MSDTKQKILDVIDEAWKNRTLMWKGSPFEKLITLSNDERGASGERLLYGWATDLTSYLVEWDEDKNILNDDGIYDEWINSKRTEVKTATRGTSNASWQHENIYSTPDLWDKLVFIDIDLNDIYITVINYDDMTFNSRHPVFDKKPTLRKNQDDKYKFDFSKRSHRLGIEAGLTFKYDMDMPDDDGFAKFLIRHFA